ncbi:MAG: regulatory protein RecX [Clostridia bacterium]|nr:regulatory protein RecX [Clostridia bacterium]
MKTVTDLKPQKNSKRVNVYLDGEFYMGMELYTVMKYRIKVGNTYSESELDAFVLDEEKNSAFNYVLNSLSKSLKTEKQVRIKLYERGYTYPIVKEVIEKLKSYGYLNDEQFVTKFVNTYSKTKGKRLIKTQLKLKGVSDSDIENVDNIIENELNSAVYVAEKYLKNKPNDIKTKQKCYRYLLSKGFSYEDSKRAVDKVLVSDEEI